MKRNYVAEVPEVFESDYIKEQFHQLNLTMHERYGDLVQYAELLARGTET